MLTFDKIDSQRSPHARYDPRAAPAPALAPFHHARPASWSPPWRGARSGSMPPPRSACAPTPGARRRRNPAGSMIAPSARSPASRSASKSAATAPACRWCRRPPDATGAVHRAARRNPGGGADLRSETADRGIQGAGDDLRSRPAAVDDGELEHGPQQRGRTAGRSAARLHRVRRSLDRSRQRIGRRRRWRAPTMSNCTAASPKARRRTIP